MNPNLRKIIKDNISNALKHIEALPAHPARPLLAAAWRSWASNFLMPHGDGTPEDAEKASAAAHEFAELYDDQKQLGLACQRIAEAVRAALQTPADEPRARRLITEANHLLTTLTS